VYVIRFPRLLVSILRTASGGSSGFMIVRAVPFLMIIGLSVIIPGVVSTPLVSMDLYILYHGAIVMSSAR